MGGAEAAEVQGGQAPGDGRPTRGQPRPAGIQAGGGQHDTAERPDAGLTGGQVAADQTERGDRGRGDGVGGEEGLAVADDGRGMTRSLHGATVARASWNTPGATVGENVLVSMIDNAVYVDLSLIHI